MELYKNREWMYYHYWVLMESTTVMAKLVGCTGVTIWTWLHKLNIPTRSCGEATFLAERNHLNMTPELQEFIEGELLGDGSIVMKGQRSASYNHGSKYEGYLIWISGKLTNWGIEQAGRINKYTSKQNGGITYHYVSKSYPELVPVRQRWYPNGKKIVLRDLKFTPIMVRQWYIGDGSLLHGKAGRPYIKLATYAFDKSSIDHLLKELSELGLKATLRSASNTIGISAYSTQDFLNYIGPCPKEIEGIYGYKWDYKKVR